MMTGAEVETGIIGEIIMLSVWLGMLAGILLLVKSLFSGQSSRKISAIRNEHDPEKIIANRFARGEIGRKEYERMKTDLR